MRKLYILSKISLTMILVDITKLSTKGQIVIPQDMRSGLGVGDKLLIVKSKDQIILKKADKLDKEFVKDVEFAEKIEKALSSMEKSKEKEKIEEIIEEFKYKSYLG